MLKIVLDKFVPYTGDAFSGIAETKVLAPSEITPEAVADADALIVRTRTRCNASLLGDSKVTFVGTATIGTDHLDLPWLKANGIEAMNAPGCNAPAVAQYVLSSILRLVPDYEGKTVGIVGVGHVGRIVDSWCRALGMKTLLCDPPRALAEGADGFCDTDEITRKADIITFHTPLTPPEKPFPTRHLADDSFFSSLERRPMIINAARGPIVDNEALLRAIAEGTTGPVVIDCWENEPNISRELLAAADIATPHIAGYSSNGKKRATQTIVRGLYRHFGIDRPFDLGVTTYDEAAAQIPSADMITDSYDPFSDTRMMREAIAADPSGVTFERLRDTYALRPEVF